MTQEKIETIMAKVQTAAVWYGMYIEKLNAKVGETIKFKN